MNNKEALQEIKDWLEYKDADWATVKYVKQIEKDLEVLDILKRLFTLEYEPKKVIIDGTITTEEFEKLKEWLKKDEN